MRAHEKQYIRGLAEDAWKDLRQRELFYGKDSDKVKGARGVWFAYNKICEEFGIKYTAL